MSRIPAFVPAAAPFARNDAPPDQRDDRRADVRIGQHPALRPIARSSVRNEARNDTRNDARNDARGDVRRGGDTNASRRADDTTQSERVAERAHMHPQFSAMLALLTGASSAQADATGDASAGDASLLDALLDGDAMAADAQSASDDELAGLLTGVAARMATLNAGRPAGGNGADNIGSNAAGGSAGASLAAVEDVLRADAAITVNALGAAGSYFASGFSPMADATGTPGVLATPGVAAGITSRVNAQADGSGSNAAAMRTAQDPADDKNAASALLSRRGADAIRGASAEQLLAMGETNAARIRTALDETLLQGSNDGTAKSAAFGSAVAAGANAAGAQAAAQAAATAAANGASTSVDTVVRDPNALVPEFRARLERVVERMKDEYGHDVTLVETSRSQARQNYLYEQGRTRPGQVVTWTHDSAHTRGQAADVLVDGDYNNTTGLARLQRIAREEGLRTLGITDPGHLELPKDAQSADRLLGGAAKVASRIEGTSFGGPVRGAAVAATVSGVASVASVAGVASVARVGGAGAPVASIASTSLTAATHSVAQASTSDASTAGTGMQGDATQARVAGSGNDSGSGSGRGSGSGSGARGEHGHGRSDGRDELAASASNVRKIPLARPTASDAAAGAAYGTPGVAAGTAAGGKAQPSAATTTDFTARATDAQDLRESMPGSISRLSMSVDGVDGNDSRITVDLRGRSVATHIEADATIADGMRSRTGELQDALGRHGLDGDTVRISSSARGDAADSARASSGERDALKLAAAQQGGASDGAATHDQREQNAARDRNAEDEARRARDDARPDEQRSRDGSRGGSREHARDGAQPRAQERDAQERNARDAEQDRRRELWRNIYGGGK